MTHSPPASSTGLRSTVTVSLRSSVICCIKVWPRPLSATTGQLRPAWRGQLLLHNSYLTVNRLGSTGQVGMLQCPIIVQLGLLLSCQLEKNWSPFLRTWGILFGTKLWTDKRCACFLTEWFPYKSKIITLNICIEIRLIKSALFELQNYLRSSS